MNLWEPGPTLNHVLDVYAITVVCLAAVPANLFPLIYSRRPWTSSFLGRALMVKAIGIALLIDVTLLYYLFGANYPYRGIVRDIIYSIVFVGITLQCISLVVAPKDRDLSNEKEKVND